ncbi:MAG: VWA domain-containing protein [Vicinamibacterales bacterium]
MRPVFVLAMAVACATVNAGAQAPQDPPQQRPVFRSGVELVTVDVTVVGRDGTPVRGLTAADFDVKLDGTPGRIQALDFLEFGAVSGTEASATGTTTARAEAEGASRGGRVFLILVDDLSYGPGASAQVATTAKRMLDAVQPNDMVGVATTSGLGASLDPTRDRVALLDVLTPRRLQGRFDDTAAPFYIGLNEAFEIDRDFPPDTLPAVAGRECPQLGLKPDSCESLIAALARGLAQGTVHRVASQMAAFEAAIRALHNAPAPRVLVVLSAGVATSIDHDLVTQVDRLAQAAAESGVQLYALTDAPEWISVADASMERANARRRESQFLVAGVQTMASAAGGEAFVVIGQPQRFLSRIERETSGVYRLGIEVGSLPADSRFVEPSVKVRRPGVTVRVNRQALVPDGTEAEIPVDQRLRTALAQGGAGYGVPLALGTAIRRAPGSGALQMGVNVQVPGSVPGPIATMFALVDEAGAILQMGRRDVVPPAAGSDYQLALPVPVATAGRYHLRFAVADAAGGLGKLELPVRAELHDMGPLLVSDLFVTSTAGGREPRFLALDALPPDAVAMNAALECYAAAGAVAPGDVSVHVEVTPVGQATPVFEGDVTPASRGDALAAVAEIPTGDLAPGAYTVAASIAVSGSMVGRLQAIVTKPASR